MRVYVVYIKQKNKFALRYKSGDKWTQTQTQARTRLEANALAGQLERKLQTEMGRPTWSRAIDLYEEQVVSGWRKNSRYAWQAALKALYRCREPEVVADISKPVLAALIAGERARGKSTESIRGNIKYLLAFLRWACEVHDAIDSVPHVRLPKPKRRAKGRAVTGEEFDRLLRAAEKVRPDDSQAFQTLMQGLYWGGLRLVEAVELRWDWDAPYAVLPGNPPLLKMSNAQKSGHAELSPIAPEFWDLIEPLQRSGGKVFQGLPHSAQYCGKVLSKIGKAARVIVNDEGKFASAHDLRRSFGTRWASRVTSVELQKLMRHADIKTTLEYYVDLDQQALYRKMTALARDAERQSRGGMRAHNEQRESF